MAVRLGAFVMAAVLVFSSLAFAENPGKAARFEHADRNDDGRVDRKEKKMEKDWELKQRSRVNNPWEERADTDNDGRVEKAEARAWKDSVKERIDLNDDGIIDDRERRMSWRHGKAKVNNPVEAKYDADNNGWLEPAEVKQMLQDKQALIKTHGKAIVDTAVEAEYDDNKDGVIDAAEAGDLKADLADE